MAKANLAKQLGYSLGDHIDVLQAPLVASAKIHVAALKRMAAREPQAVSHLLHLESQYMYAGQLLPADDSAGRVKDLLKQDSEFLDDLMEDALRAQAYLKNIFIPKTAKLRRSGPKGMLARMKSRARGTKASCPLLEFVSSAFETGVKDLNAVRRKAERQGGTLQGVPLDHQVSVHLDRIFDIARITLQVQTAQHMLLLVCGLMKLFDVVAIENRFAKPTALGWMDVIVLVRVPLDEGRSHIAEVRVELLDICKARIDARACVETMQSNLQYFGVSSQDVDQALRIIFHALESPSLTSSLSMSTLTTAPILARLKSQVQGT